ncbi:hypothetical protein TNCV_2804981 [Trichonephila clavipes]|nr:hypothetical protein TNCV_2804981 [Trichonephila clavipes]
MMEFRGNRNLNPLQQNAHDLQDRHWSKPSGNGRRCQILGSNPGATEITLCRAAGLCSKLSRRRGVKVWKARSLLKF